MKRLLPLPLLVGLFLFGLTAANALPTHAETQNPLSAAVPPVPPPNLPLQTPAAGLALAAPLDTPTQLVSTGVSYYYLAAPKLFWYTNPGCAPTRPIKPNDVPAEQISRIPTYGGLVRQLYYHATNYYCPGNAEIYSNIVADSNYVYFTTTAGLQRLSTGANVGDPYSLFNASVKGSAFMALDDTNVYALTYDYGTGSAIATVWIVRKSDGALMYSSNLGQNAGNLASDGSYLFWIQNYTALVRSNLDGSGRITIATGVTGFYPDGERVTCGQFFCLFTNDTFYAKGNQVYYYENHFGSTTGPIYQSSYVAGAASVYSLTSDGTNLYLFESRQTVCSPFCNYNDVLLRTPRYSNPASSGTPIFNGGPYLNPQFNGPLTTDGTFLYWGDGGIERLPNDASALPMTNMRVTGLEITQGVQNLSNSIQLVQSRRTFVRVYVKSDGPAVPGVTASLYGAWDGGGSYFTLSPVNPAGPNLTVNSSPQRNNLNDSFLFELPWDWLTHSNLQLTASLNPNHVPLQASYANNILTSGPFNFVASPRLSVQFISWGYTINNTVYYPRLIKDVLQTYSWVRRAYPLSSKSGGYSDPSPGFRPNLWLVYDDQLGPRVLCNPGCDNLRASAYANAQMDAMRTENSLPTSLFFYGMISDAAGYFPRGQACCGSNVSTGPAGVPAGNFGWDNDGSYADWYAGHEIGHTLGRAHPTPGSATCGHSASDPGYPYPNADIGPNVVLPAADSTLEGFDVGDPDPAFNLPIRIYPGVTWHDVMSYCNNQWVSDYTYNAMYSYMIAHPSAPQGVRKPLVTGDFLSVYGAVISGTNTAQIFHLRRVSSVTSIPPITPGPYSIQLLDVSNAVLANYPFTPSDDSDNPAYLPFGQVVNFVAGTRLVRIMQGSIVLATMNVSATPPNISNVSLQGAPNPVNGTVTLAWTANDPGGSPLHFDILYSRDSGATFQILQLNVSGNSAQVDTSRLGGSGTAILRVVANNGSQSAQADTAPFTMANKPPQVHIDFPGNGQHIRWAQLLNLSGWAEDFQDGSVADAGLSWIAVKAPLAPISLGTGSLLTYNTVVPGSVLPVGPNVITLTATDSVGQSASTSITVYVDDDLSLPGPTLTAGPDQFGWQVAPGTTQVQTANLDISNAGSGTLNWTASTNAAWVTLSQYSGTAPTVITVSANPGGMLDGAVANATITLSSSGLPTPQVITIPVSLGIGVNPAFRPSTAATKLLDLPILLNGAAP